MSHLKLVVVTEPRRRVGNAREARMCWLLVLRSVWTKSSYLGAFWRLVTPT